MFKAGDIVQRIESVSSGDLGFMLIHHSYIVAFDQIPNTDRIMLKGSRLEWRASAFTLVQEAKEAKEAKEENDPVNSPSHYTRGGVECIDVIKAWGLDYHRGNALKYICRAGHKDPGKESEDLRKAAWMLLDLAEELEK